MDLHSNGSQEMSKCSQNISDTPGFALCATFLFLPHFEVICDLLLNTDAKQHGIYFLNLSLFFKNVLKRLMEVVNA